MKKQNKVHFIYRFKKINNVKGIDEDVKLCNFGKASGDTKGEDTKDKDKVTCQNCSKILKKGFLQLFNYNSKKKERVEI